MTETPIDYEKIRAIIKAELKPLWEKIDVHDISINVNRDRITTNTTNLLWVIWMNRILIGINLGLGGGISYIIFN